MTPDEDLSMKGARVSGFFLFRALEFQPKSQALKPQARSPKPWTPEALNPRP